MINISEQALQYIHYLIFLFDTVCSLMMEKIMRKLLEYDHFICHSVGIFFQNCCSSTTNFVSLFRLAVVSLKIKYLLEYHK